MPISKNNKQLKKSLYNLHDNARATEKETNELYQVATEDKEHCIAI